MCVVFSATAVVAALAVAVAAPPAVGSVSGDTGSISGGDNFTCAVTSGATVKCWGANTHGQLGNGTTEPHLVPQLVPGLTDVAEVSAGWQHACALTTAGGVKCWGLNADGQVGIGTTNTPQTTPVDVEGLTSGVQAISAGGFHTCALTDAGGVKCWGNNPSGGLGDGTTVDRSSPVDVVGLDAAVTSIAGGGDVTCAVLDNGGVKCWGNNAVGGVGDGTTINRSTPTDVVGLDSGVASVSAAGTYPFGARACAVTTGGAVKCWGANNQGQLGDGTTTHRSSPVDVAGLASGVAMVTTGSSQTCALTTAGAAKCWGQWGVGVGNNDVHPVPLDVVGLGSGVVEVQAGGYHTCARSDTGAVRCWGGNNAGQLGLGVTGLTLGLVPRDVSGSFHRPECPTVVPNPDTSFTSTDGYAVGSSLLFTADPGFVLSGATSLTCQADLTFDSTAPTATPSSTITIDPPSGIHGGDDIGLVLSGFAPETDIGWCQAVDDSPTGTGNCSAINLGTTDATGSLATTLRVDRFIHAPGPARWADCAAETCLLGAAAVNDLEGTAVTVPLDIVVDAPPATPGTVTLDPLRQNPGEATTVTGSGFRPDRLVEVFQCRNDATSPSDCSLPLARTTTDGSGDFVTSVAVTASIQPQGGTSTSCYTPSGACSLVVAEAQDFPGTTAQAPLADIGPVPTVLPGAGIVEEGDDGTTTLNITVTLSNDWHEPIDVPWSTIFSPVWDPDLRADPGEDYLVASGTVRFDPFETSKSVVVPIIGDREPEGNELLVVSFQSPGIARMGGFYGLGFGGILDDDGPP